MKINIKEKNKIYKINHDIKTPINAIIGYASLIADKTENINIKKYSNNIIFASNIICSLINELNEATLDDNLYQKEKFIFIKLKMMIIILFFIKTPY